MTDKKQILLITERGVGFTVNALCEALVKADMEVKCIACNDRKLIENIDKAMVIIITECFDADIMHTVGNECNSKKKQLFLFGNPNEISTMKRAFSEMTAYTEFVRPVNFSKIVSQAKKTMTFISKKEDQKKVLVVDDSGVMLRTVMGWLEGKYDVSLANSAITALKAIEFSRPDLILLDYEMPLCNGTQFMQMMSAEEDYTDIPIIFFTSRDDKETISEVMKLKPKGYILKTATPEQLLDKLKEFFSSQTI